MEPRGTAGRLLDLVTAPIRLPGELLLALPEVVGELPRTVRGLNLVVEELARLAGPEGELTLLLREAAWLAARSEGRRPPSVPEGRRAQ